MENEPQRFFIHGVGKSRPVSSVRSEVRRESASRTNLSTRTVLRDLSRARRAPHVVLNSALRLPERKDEEESLIDGELAMDASYLNCR